MSSACLIARVAVLFKREAVARARAVAVTYSVYFSSVVVPRHLRFDADMVRFSHVDLSGSRIVLHVLSLLSAPRDSIASFVIASQNSRLLLSFSLSALAADITSRGLIVIIFAILAAV